MMKKRKNILSGLYLVIDPAMNEELLFQKLKVVLDEEIAAVQLWDHFSSESQMLKLIPKLSILCHKKDTPIIINNKWELLNHTELGLDGVHFDDVPNNYEQIKDEIKGEFICGITCNNDLSVVHWAKENQVNYLSFCSIFPSTTSNSCELVEFDTVRRTKEICNLPIFLSGGIKVDRMSELDELPYDGVAVVSGIMEAEQPKIASHAYINHLKAR